MSRSRTAKKAAVTLVQEPQAHAEDRLEARPASPQLELYQREDDRASHEVRRQLSRLGLDFIAHSVQGHDWKHQQLVQASGQDRIPFLIDHRSGVKLGGSGEIRAYLVKEYGPVETVPPSPMFPATLVLRAVRFARADVLPRLPTVARRRVSQRLNRVERASLKLSEGMNDARETVAGAFRLLRWR